MLRLIETLGLPTTTVTELQSKGFIYVEDLINNPEHLQKLSIHVSEIKKLLQFSETMALDIWQSESQKGSISTCCPNLDAIFSSGIQCGVITELSGTPFSGKTQICMQLGISVQLNKCHGGLNGRAIYIDTRNGISATRFSDITFTYFYYKLLYTVEKQSDHASNCFTISYQLIENINFYSHDKLYFEFNDHHHKTICAYSCHFSEYLKNSLLVVNEH